jgi:hypothetical protein
MKKIITLAIIALLTLNLSAQKIEKGIWQIEIGTGIGAGFDWTTGGTIDHDITTNGTSIGGIYPISSEWSDLYNSETVLDYNLDFTNFDNWEDRFLNGVSFGYFVADGFLVGLSLDLGGINLNNDTITSITTNTIMKSSKFDLGATPKIRYYIETGRGNAMFFESSFGIGLDNKIISNEFSNGDWNELKTNSFGSTIGLGFGWSIFNFNSREIFSVEPMFGFNINSRTTNTVSTTYNDATDMEYIDDKKESLNSMGAYFKLKLAFHLGRHFWSH